MPDSSRSTTPAPDLSDPIARPPTAFAEQVLDTRAGNVRLLALQTPVRSVVSWRASFHAYPDFTSADPLLQELAVLLLDKGTRRRDRFAIAEALENRGAQLHFYSDGLRIGCSGRALREDVPLALEVLAEQLREPLFSPDEFAKARAQVAADLHRSMESTGARASGALARALYAPGHPNFDPAPEEDLARLQDLTVDDVVQYHETHFGAKNFILALVGDLDPQAAGAAVLQTIGDWPEHAAPPAFSTETAPSPLPRSTVPMADKFNVDVRMGHPLDIRRSDDEYIPLYLGNYILGGNFSARLMTVIRDEMGLTYGIGSGLAGVATEHGGHWQIGVTLSQDAVERGIDATRAEIERFVTGGITETELVDKKTTLTGLFKVGLATSGGLAAALLANAERGFEVDYLDRYPALIEAVTRNEVEAVVRRRLRPGDLHVALAGTLEKENAKG